MLQEPKIAFGVWDMETNDFFDPDVSHKDNLIVGYGITNTPRAFQCFDSVNPNYLEGYLSTAKAVYNEAVRGEQILAEGRLIGQSIVYSYRSGSSLEMDLSRGAQIYVRAKIKSSRNYLYENVKIVRADRDPMNRIVFEFEDGSLWTSAPGDYLTVSENNIIALEAAA